MKEILCVPHEKVFALRFRDLSYVLDDGTRLLDRVDFLFPSHEIIRLIGKEGAGVSTVLRLLGGLRAPTAGEYLINEKTLVEMELRSRTAWQISIGFGFDHGGLLSNYSLLDNLLLPLDYHQLVAADEREKRCRQYLAHFGIESFADALPAFVSPGVRKACVLARAFVMNPRILILDEPTHSIHRASVQKLVDLIRWHQKEMGLQQVFVCTEDEYFLGEFDCETIEIAQKALIQKRKGAGHGAS